MKKGLELEYSADEHSIFPKSCELCKDNLMEFYSQFLSNDDIYYRKSLIDNLIKNIECDCYKKVLTKLK